MIQLQSDITQFEKAVQVADIQIRLTKRMVEYQSVFKNFYEHLDALTLPSIVVIAGDIFETKTDLSPESVRLCKDFFINVADRKPTILIAGNHDANLANKNRLDSLTPIVEAIKHPNLHYLHESGLYGIGNILFNNMSVFDSPEKYIRGEDIPALYKNQYHHYIGLYHGTVDEVVNDLGYKMVNRDINCQFFDGHHIVMLGDIHKAQTLQEFDDGNSLKPVIRYCGSMIQQNHGENLDGHGYTLWDLQQKEYMHVGLGNEYGYVTIDIKNGELITDINNLPFKSRLRVRCLESVPTEVKKIMEEIRGKTDVQEVVYDRVPSEECEVETIITSEDLNLADLDKLDHQETLITKYIQTKFGVEDEDKIAAVLAVNKEMNDSIVRESSTASNRWKPKKFEWSNMFSYGEDNVIDFTKLRGLYGLFAPNRSGKSSVMSALSFCIFDKCDRTSKASDVLNIHKSGFECKFNFEIDGVDYFIKREGKADRKGNVKVETNFWKVEDGEEKSLNGEKRSETNDKIREYLGTYEDFVLTSLSVQNVKNTSNFIDIGHTERKDILSQFLGLGIFDQLHEVASEKLKEYTTILKMFSKEDESSRSSELSKMQVQFTELYNDKLTEKSELNKKLDEYNKEIVSATSKLIKLDESIGSWTEDQMTKKVDELKKSIESSKTELENHKQSVQKQLPDIQKTILTKQEELSKIEAEISEIEKKNIAESYKKYQTALSELNRLDTELTKWTVIVKNHEEKLEHLKEHDYDPNCPFCVKNAGKVAEQAIETKKKYEEDVKKRNDSAAKVSEYKATVEGLKWVVNEQTVFNNRLAERNRIKDSVTVSQNKINEIEKSVEKKEHSTKDSIREYETEIKTWEERLQKFRDNKDAIESNFKVSVEIKSLKSGLSKVQDDIKSVDKTIEQIVSRLGVAKTQIQEIEDKVKKAEETEKLVQAYNYYVKAVCRDGIPYELICGAVPEIEREVNLILNQVGEFHAKFETDGKNIVPYISDGDNKWTMGLSSGFEKFALGLAIRVALINLSNLPRPNFLVVDEGFGTADADNLTMMYPLFGFLRTNFDFILIISHLDSMKDMVDGAIEITKDAEFSNVNFC